MNTDIEVFSNVIGARCRVQGARNINKCVAYSPRVKTECHGQNCCQNLLSQLPVLHDLSSDALLAYYDYNTLMQFQIGMQQEGRNIFDLDSTEMATVNYLADYGYGSSKLQALGILEYAYGQHFYCCPSLPDSLTLKRYDPNIYYYNEDDVIQVSVKPNPANTWVAIDYCLPFSASEGVLTIIDVSGQIVESKLLSQNQGQEVIDTRHLPSGVYLYKIESSGYSSSGKLVIR